MNDYYDPLLEQAIDFVVEKRRASVSTLQRLFRIGYNRAARLIEIMELLDIVSPPGHNGNREVIADVNLKYDMSRLKALFDQQRKSEQEEAERQYNAATSVEMQVKISAITNKKICIWLTDTGRVSSSGEKVLILNSSSPFEYLVSNQTSKIKPGDAEYSDILDGYRFSAVMKMNTPTNVLCQHGREEKLPAHKLPRIVKNDTQGAWLPRIRPASEIGDWARDVIGAMSSEVGTIPSDGGDYLRFLIFTHSIIEGSSDDEERLKWLNLCYHMVGSDGEPISNFMDHHGNNTEDVLRNIEIAIKSK